jgi:serine/threonine protein kinase
VLASKTKIYIVSELATGGELFYKLAHEGKFDESKARYYFQQLISGMEYCHAKGVCHRDLKPENLLLNEDQILKISDFGLSALHRTEDGSKLLYTTCGTPNYVAPEVLGDKGYEGTSADVWSCGVILFVFLAGYLPFDENSTDLLFKKIQKGHYKIPPWFTAGSRALITRILVVDPSKRITIDDIKADEWFKINNETPTLATLPPSSLIAPAIPAIPPSFQSIDEEGAENLHHSQESDEPDERELPNVVINGLTVTNAFDLIALSGVLDMTRMLAPPPPEEQIMRYTKWSSVFDADRILTRLANTLNQLGITHTVNPKRYKIRVTHTTPHKGQLTFRIQIFLMAPGLHMVDFRKGLGDIAEFHRIYKQLCEECKDIIGSNSKK